ncbi:uncharacterized protein LOC103524904 isoform X3 [Diaphorina citri]|uniref:Uncharacterized protein LOC103524904 isoform X3 n=1 Tax=Diaphorina citri TaxID=121845 RepID=A0A1S3DUF1_DIACI|nr:uncharacterized protein LOC103524904 isoform X3 [Diaphorina citri]
MWNILTYYFMLIWLITFTNSLSSINNFNNNESKFSDKSKRSISTTSMYDSVEESSSSFSNFKSRRIVRNAKTLPKPNYILDKKFKPTSATNFGPPVNGPNNQQPFPPPSRSSITPPLPPEFLNPFADKPSLRGSHSDSNNIPMRKPIPPMLKLPEKELIPIKPPDLALPDTRRKTLNTPSSKKLPELEYTATSSTTTPTRSNETFDFVPIGSNFLPYPSVSRILSGGGGRRHDPLQEFLENKLKQDNAARHSKLDNLKNLLPPNVAKDHEQRIQLIKDLASSSTTAVLTTITSTTTTTTTTEQPATEIPFIPFKESVEDNLSKDDRDSSEEDDLQNQHSESQPSVKEKEIISDNHLEISPQPRARYVLGIAWDIHVYIIATLFAILAVVSVFNIVRITSYKRLVNFGYFLTLHSLLLVIGGIRSAYLFYDAYNINNSLPESVSKLALNIVFPLLTASFSLLFLYLLKITDVRTKFYRLQSAVLLLILVIAHVVFVVSVDLCTPSDPAPVNISSVSTVTSSSFTSYSSLLPLISQCLFVLLCVVLGVTYIYLYKTLSHASLRKQATMFGTSFTDPHRSSLYHAVRVALAVAMLSLLMAVLQLYGMFGVYELLSKDQPHPWLWWGFQFSVRVIEVSICFLLCWAGVRPLRCEDEKETQSHNSASGFALFACAGTNTPRSSEGGPGDDFYPTICSTNQAVHTYNTLRSNKHIYEDTYALGRLTMDKKAHCHDLKHLVHPLNPPLHHPNPLVNGAVPYNNNNNNNNEINRRLQSSPSMLVAENGFVRFRSLADAEQHHQALVQSNPQFAAGQRETDSQEYADPMQPPPSQNNLLQPRDDYGMYQSHLHNSHHIHSLHYHPSGEMYYN